MTLKAVQLNVRRLQAILTYLEDGRLAPGQLNLATFYATHRHDPERAPVGCVLGHFARSGLSHSISLIPINSWQQTKSPIMAETLAEDHPRSDWQHWTLHYSTLTAEAWGETAALLYLNAQKWDLYRLFYPAGASYEIRPPVESLVFRLQMMVKTLGGST